MKSCTRSRSLCGSNQNFTLLNISSCDFVPWWDLCWPSSCWSSFHHLETRLRCCAIKRETRSGWQYGSVQCIARGFLLMALDTLVILAFHGSNVSSGLVDLVFNPFHTLKPLPFGCSWQTEKFFNELNSLCRQWAPQNKLPTFCQIIEALVVKQSTVLYIRQ